MVRRLTKLKKNNSLFLFGARGTGKTTLIHEQFSQEKCLWLNLLECETEEKLRTNPSEMSQRIAKEKPNFVVIDEIQKLPSLLDRVHMEIEKKGPHFVLTGSSARKLKREGTNLLAGRAFTNYLFPLTFQELDDKLSLDQVLQFGSLPKLLSLKSTDDYTDYLQSYVQTYLMEEIIVEQVVRNVPPFKDFLRIAAQSNGTLINYSKISNDIGVDDKTVREYFEILQDTLLGFYLPPYHRSIRKRQRVAPKFYLFDTGVKRALDRTLKVPLEARTYAYGKAFEHRVILEAYYANLYKKMDYDFSYLRTKDDAEIDLIIDRPGRSTLLVEIKSKDKIQAQDVTRLAALHKDWKGKAEAQFWSLDPFDKKIGSCVALHWQRGLKEAGL